MRIKAILAPQRPRKDRAVWLTATILATAVPFAGAQALVTERRVAAEPVEAIAAVPAVTPRPAAPPVPAASPADAPGPAPAVESRPGAAPAPVLSHPVAHGRISSRYGNRAARPAGSAPFHGGYDIAAAEGTPVVAPGAGVIVHAAAGYRGSERWGNTVAIDHGDGWQTVYAHLQDFGVAPGDRVEAGQQIGRVGTTGAVTGPHVHVELHHNGERVDPADHVPGLR
jgi:murein DD-endopeptidase MepM/ murein hydrolase activator NlpD